MYEYSKGLKIVKMNWDNGWQRLARMGWSSVYLAMTDENLDAEEAAHLVKKYVKTF